MVMPALIAKCVTFAARAEGGNKMKCLICGIENNTCLCESCRAVTDIEKLCMDVISYVHGSGVNPVWESICEELDKPYHFRNIAFALSADLPIPKREYIRALFLTGDSANIQKNSRPWFYEVYASVRNNPMLSLWEKHRLDGIALGAYYMDYEYEAAEQIAQALSASQDVPYQVVCNMGEFYTITRRYDLAERVLTDALSHFADDETAVARLKNVKDKNEKQHQKAAAGKQEYLPNPNENRDEARQKYIAFLASIGIEATLPKPSLKATKIPKDQYPAPVEIREADFDSFVAFDLETTGFSDIDSIIEIGAIRVVGGVVQETAEFTFQELVYPMDHKRVKPEITALTGITDAEVRKARPISEVFPDFMRFVGDDILLGFNCISFDSRFITRAGRYTNIIITNPYFDVMHYASEFKYKLGYLSSKVALGELAHTLNIENPRAHRALADAITTARVFLKLKEYDTAPESVSVDDLLSDLDEW